MTKDNNKSPKRLVFTVINDLNYDQRMIRICQSLHQAGYEVLLLGSYRSWSAPLQIHDFEQRRLPVGLSKGKLFYFLFNLRLFFFLLWHPYDALCSVDLDTVLPGFMAARLRRKKQFFDAHELFTEMPEVIRRPMVQRIWSWIGHWTIPKIGQAYTVGTAIAAVLEEKYKIPFAVIRNLPSTSALPPEEKTLHDPIILIYQGYLNEGRGIETIVQAMETLPNHQLWLVGDGPLRAQLEALVHQLNLSEKVRFWGYQLPEQLAEITTQAHIGLNLLDPESRSYYYSLANKTFDYLQAGIPAIHMDFPEYRLLIDQYEIGYCIPQLTKDDLIRVVKTISQAQVWSKMAINCAKAAPIFTWQKEEIILLDWYKERL